MGKASAKREIML